MPVPSGYAFLLFFRCLCLPCLFFFILFVRRSHPFSLRMASNGHAEAKKASQVSPTHTHSFFHTTQCQCQCQRQCQCQSPEPRVRVRVRQKPPPASDWPKDGRPCWRASFLVSLVSVSPHLALLFFSSHPCQPRVLKCSVCVCAVLLRVSGVPCKNRTRRQGTLVGGRGTRGGG